MNSKHMIASFCAAGLAFGMLADVSKTAPAPEEASELSWAPGEGVTFGETSVVSTEVGLSFDSRYMTYGVIDGKDPILTPSATMKFFDWAYFSVESIFDVTKGNGIHKEHRGDYGNRAGRYTTIDAIAGLAHDFDTCDAIGALSVDFNYIYEYIHRYHDEDGVDCVDDTQYLNLELSLGDLWFEPAFAVERDLIADDGTYFNFSVGHGFALIDGEGEGDDPVLAFRPSVGQGFGNTQRVRGYLPRHKDDEEMLDHGGFMDTTIKGELTWNIAAGVSLSAYVAYSDYWLDSNMREGARAHNAAWGPSCDKSWNVYGGVALGLSF